MLRIFNRGEVRKSQGPKFGGVRVGERPWLVLGGGGLKGLAHLGAWRVLRDGGFEPEGIVGTSIGALVGACLAGAQPLDEIEGLARRITREDIARMPRRLLWSQGIRSSALYRSDVLRGYIASVVPKGGWQSLSTRFQLNAVELGSGRTEWFGSGARTDVLLADAVYASAALPLFYPPCMLPGGLYVDGGTRDALPIRRAAELGATGIVAIDVGSSETANAPAVVDRGMLAIHERVFSIMSGCHRRQVVKEWTGPPLLYIRPELDDFGILEFKHLDQIIEEGRRAMKAALSGSSP